MNTSTIEQIQTRLMPHALMFKKVFDRELDDMLTDIVDLQNKYGKVPASYNQIEHPFVHEIIFQNNPTILEYVDVLKAIAENFKIN